MGPSIIIPRWVEQEVMGQHHSTYAATLRKGGQHSGVTRNTDFHADLELAGGCRMDSKVSELLDQRTAFRGILRWVRVPPIDCCDCIVREWVRVPPIDPHLYAFIKFQFE
jgi:hypothetical protein